MDHPILSVRVFDTKMLSLDILPTTEVQLLPFKLNLNRHFIAAIIIIYYCLL